VLAARFLGEVGDVRRFPSKHHVAAHTAPPRWRPSSGQVVRHRLSRAGDRKLHHALSMMAMVQVRRPSAGQAYYQRKLAEGKSPKEALRCLKRWLSGAVYRCVLADQHLQPSWSGCGRCEAAKRPSSPSSMDPTRAAQAPPTTAGCSTRRGTLATSPSPVSSTRVRQAPPAPRNH
jgi:hypothetical protein